jgi:hypothetical protein
VKFDSVEDPVQKISVPIDIFVTDVFQLTSDKWLLIDRDQMTGYVFPGMEHVILDVELGGLV